MIDFKTLKRNLKKDTSGIPTIKVSLLGDSATQFLATAIKSMGVERGYNIDLFEAEYNQVERQVFDPTSDLYLYETKYTNVNHLNRSGSKKFTLMLNNTINNIK